MSAPSSHPKQRPAELAAPFLDPDRTVASDLSGMANATPEPTLSQAVDDALPPEPQRPKVPGYQILDVLGRGGMGVVYKARQVGLGRHVALKMILSGAHAGPEDMVRFLAEAEAVAQLQHTNIVQIYQVGKHGDVPFFSLEYVDGGNLAQRLDGTPQQPRDAAQLIECLARAMHAAHQKGIVHRDLKPSNILLASGGRQPPVTDETTATDEATGGLRPPLADCIPKITDFGLAKRVEGGGGLTQTGAILGTPSYMAPEQAEAKKDVGPATDIYALGSILYEMLTGRPPFRAPTQVETILHLLSDEPVSPTRLQPGCPRDVETICLKCLHKEPTKRYTTAEALADDLQRFLTDRPIQARRTGALERLRRWRRRNPVLAAMTSAVALLLLLLAAGSLLAAVWLNRARRTAEDNLGRAESAEQLRTEQLATSYLEQARARRYSRQVGQRFQSLAALTEAARIVRGMDLDDEQRAERLGELRNEAIACLALVDLRSERRLADVFINNHGTGFQQAVAFTPKWDVYARAESEGTISVRRVEDDGEILRLPGSGPSAYNLIFSPDGRYLAAKYFRLEKPIEYLVWEWRTGRTVVQQACDVDICPCIDFAFTRDSRHVLLGCRRDALLGRYDLATGKETGILDAGAAMPWTIALHPDGRRLATVSGNVVTIRDAETGTPLGAPWRLPRNIWSVAWHGGSDLLAAASDNRIHLWDAGTRRERGVLEGHEDTVAKLAFNRSGTLLASYGWEGTTRLWDPAVGKELLHLPGDFLEFNSDGRRLAYVSGQELGIWEVRTGEDVCRQLVQPDRIRQTRFGPADRLLASAAMDGVYLWDVRSGRQLARLNLGETTAALFQPSGDLLTVTRWGLSYRWPMRRMGEGDGRLRLGPANVIPLPKPKSADMAALDSGGHKLAVADLGRQVSIVDLDAKSPLVLLAGHPRVNFVDISPDGRWVATSTFKGANVKVWDLDQPDPRKEAASFQTGERANAYFSLDGRWLVVDEPVQLRRYYYRVGSWDVMRQERIAMGEMGGVGFTDGGMMAATSQGGREVRLLDTATDRTWAILPSLHGRPLHALNFNRDGSRLAAVGERRVQLWDLRALRAHLAEMDLDWQTPPYPPDSEPPAEPLTVAVEGAPAAAPMERPVIVLVPSPAGRQATAEEIAAWLRQLGDADAKVRQTSAQALAEVGAPAVKALTVIAEAPRDQRRMQARAVLDRIAVTEALAPRRVRLHLKNVLPKDAIQALAAQTNLPLIYRPGSGAAAARKSISLDLDDVSLWEALDRICAEGGLGIYVNASTIWASPAVPGRETVHGRAGPFRLEVVAGTISRSFQLRGPNPGVLASQTLQLRLFLEPRIRLLSLRPPRLLEARGMDGQSLLPATSPALADQVVPAGTFWRNLQIPLKPSGDRKGKMQLLKGVLPLDVMVRRRDRLIVPDVAKAQGRTFRADGDCQLGVDSVERQGNRWTLSLRFITPPGWRFDPNQHGLELTDARGRSVHFNNVALTQWPLREPQPEDLAWLTAAPQAPSLSRLPWTALALQPARQGRTEWRGKLQLVAPTPFEGPVTLRFYRFDRLKTEVPFELRDVPLP